MTQFIHDCDKCISLGWDNGKDYYFCPGFGGDPGSLIIRTGDDGPEYSSLPVDTVKPFLDRDSRSDFAQLYRLAQDRGYIPR